MITNLPRMLFKPNMIKELYNLRWDIEILFRHLKCATIC